MPLKEDEKKESYEETLRNVEREMAKPRIAKSARRAAAVDPVRGAPSTGTTVKVHSCCWKQNYERANPQSRTQRNIG